MNTEPKKKEIVKSVEQLYVEYRVIEFMETLPDGLLMRQWLFFNLMAFFTFLTWMLTDIKVLPDLMFLIYMTSVWLDIMESNENNTKTSD